MSPQFLDDKITDGDDDFFSETEDVFQSRDRIPMRTPKTLAERYAEGEVCIVFYGSSPWDTRKYEIICASNVFWGKRHFDDTLRADVIRCHGLNVRDGKKTDLMFVGARGLAKSVEQVIPSGMIWAGRPWLETFQSGDHTWGHVLTSSLSPEESIEIVGISGEREVKLVTPYMAIKAQCGSMDSLIQRISSMNDNTISLAAQHAREVWQTHLHRINIGLRFRVDDHSWRSF